MTIWHDCKTFYNTRQYGTTARISFLTCHVKHIVMIHDFYLSSLQPEPFNGQSNNFSGSGFQYNQGNMNGVSRVAIFIMKVLLYSMSVHMLDKSICNLAKCFGRKCSGMLRAYQTLCLHYKLAHLHTSTM